jgi:PAS domain-containing protein
MSQKEIEIILMRQLASYLAMPIFVVDPEGTLLFYNEPAEALLGRRFDEAGEMAMGEWSTMFAQRDEDNLPLPPDAIPLVAAVRERRPAHRTLRITGLDGVARTLEVTAFPIKGQSGRHLGAVAIFWGAEHL